MVDPPLDPHQDDLHSTRAQLELVLEHLPVITYTGRADATFRTTYMSANVEAVTGCAPEEFIEHPGRWIERIHPDDVRTPFVTLDQLSHERAFEVEYRWRCADGSWIWFLDAMRLARHERDGSLIIVGALLDITRRKGSESVLHETREQARELAARLFRIREEEQRRMSRELHDELGQMLTALRLDVEWLTRRTGDDPRVAAHVARMASTVDATLDEVRRLARDLRPTVLDDLGLAAAVGMHVDRVRDLTGLDVRMSIELGDEPPDDERSTAVFRMLQEALTNVARHAHARSVQVSLERSGDSLRLVVHDDGRGITDAEAHGRASLGLAGLRERARLLDGHADVRAHPEGGTVVVAVLPLPAR